MTRQQPGGYPHAMTNPQQGYSPSQAMMNSQQAQGRAQTPMHAQQAQGAPQAMMHTQQAQGATQALMHAQQAQDPTRAMSNDSRAHAITQDMINHQLLLVRAGEIHNMVQPQSFPQMTEEQQVHGGVQAVVQMLQGHASNPGFGPKLSTVAEAVRTTTEHALFSAHSAMSPEQFYEFSRTMLNVLNQKSTTVAKTTTEHALSSAHSAMSPQGFYDFARTMLDAKIGRAVSPPAAQQQPPAFDPTTMVSQFQSPLAPATPGGQQLSGSGLMISLPHTPQQSPQKSAQSTPQGTPQCSQQQSSQHGHGASASATPEHQQFGGSTTTMSVQPQGFSGPAMMPQQFNAPQQFGSPQQFSGPQQPDNPQQLSGSQKFGGPQQFRGFTHTMPTLPQASSVPAMMPQQFGGSTATMPVQPQGFTQGMMVPQQSQGPTQAAGAMHVPASVVDLTSDETRPTEPAAPTPYQGLIPPKGSRAVATPCGVQGRRSALGPTPTTQHRVTKNTSPKSNVQPKLPHPDALLQAALKEAENPPANFNPNRPFEHMAVEQLEVLMLAGFAEHGILPPDFAVAQPGPMDADPVISPEIVAEVDMLFEGDAEDNNVAIAPTSQVQAPVQAPAQASAPKVRELSAEDVAEMMREFRKANRPRSPKPMDRQLDFLLEPSAENLEKLWPEDLEALGLSKPRAAATGATATAAPADATGAPAAVTAAPAPGTEAPATATDTPTTPPQSKYCTPSHLTTIEEQYAYGLRQGIPPSWR